MSRFEPKPPLDLAACQPFPRLVFIPMLTPNDGSGEGRVTKYECGERRRVLSDSFRLAVESGQRDIRSLRDMLGRWGIDFLPYRDADYFEHETRQAYFAGVPTDWLAGSVVFLDPDIGLETRTTGYMRANGLDKYLMYADLSRLAARVPGDSVIVVYRHLQRDASLRAGDVQQRLRDVSTHLATPFVWAVQWVDVAFLVAARDGAVATRVGRTIGEHVRRHGGMLSEVGSAVGATTAGAVSDLRSVRTLRLGVMVATDLRVRFRRKRPVNGGASAGPSVFDGSRV